MTQRAMTPPRLPLVPRLVNRAGSALRSLGITPVRLETQALLDAASTGTGLSDFGDDRFRDALDRLLDSLEREGRLHLLGRFIVRADLLRGLENRLRMVDWHARHPEIGEQEIRRPIVIVGQGRTGTTILHELLALDPDNRLPLTWEVDHPTPPPERASYQSDPRIAKTQKMLDRSEQLIPDFKKIHRMGATLPQECVRMTATEFASIIFTATWRVPGYTEWLLNEADMGPVYRAHRRMLQLLQWRCPAKRWVLKSPGHLWSLDDLATEYPDARLIQTHRDPLEILSSLTSLEVVLRSMASDGVVAGEVSREWSRWNCLGYERSVDFRERRRLPASQIVDVHFREFIRDPLAEVRRIYGHFELELRPNVERAMRAYIDRNPSDRDGRHRHAFAETGLDAEEERQKVKRYQDYFGVESAERF